MDQLYKGYHEHRDSVVARRELDARSGKFGEQIVQHRQLRGGLVLWPLY